MKTDIIDAVIGGEQARFRLERNQPFLIQQIEHKVGKSLFALFRDIADGTWSTRAFLPVLSAAHVGAPHRLMGSESVLVRRTLEGQPPGVYAPLVAKVLEAHLFGLPEEEATFTDAAA
ncbi:MAG: gene transfer agent family protein [Bosea sp.]|uniref:GTA-gp10 family protein n=1 Tax=Bosea sp. (in: a-proteobacteria) TaxID=1871050 RepID=UPI001AD29010|nr:GTA-gp10 family protein [Bosea sp. (in: a-proteobacteria)]MBN9470198.1 gene transfer agent family protein [Bosea sp. (in: a-proteobacteria)]